MKESKEYLEQLGHKATTYYKARQAAIDYINKWDIDSKIATDLIIISQVWTANLYKETIRDQELAVRLNITDPIILKNEELLLSDEMKDLQLVEVFERYIDSVT